MSLPGNISLLARFKATPSGSSPVGTPGIAATQVAFGSGANQIKGSANLTFVEAALTASGSANLLNLTPTYAQTGAGAVTDFRLNRTGTVGTGLQSMMDLQAYGTSWYWFGVGNAASTGAFNASSGTETAVVIAPNFAGQTGTAGNTSVTINPSSTGAGSGTAALLRLQVAGSNKASFFSDGSATFCADTANPAGGNANRRILIGSGAIGIYYGSGAPTISAAQGSIYLRSDGSGTANRMYVNNSAGSGTTWTAVTTIA